MVPRPTIDLRLRFHILQCLRQRAKITSYLLGTGDGSSCIMIHAHVTYVNPRAGYACVGTSEMRAGISMTRRTEDLHYNRVDKQVSRMSLKTQNQGATIADFLRPRQKPVHASGCSGGRRCIARSACSHFNRRM